LAFAEFFGDPPRRRPPRH